MYTQNSVSKRMMVSVMKVKGVKKKRGEFIDITKEHRELAFSAPYKDRSRKRAEDFTRETKMLSGETETLITNLLFNRMGLSAFKVLYFKRWLVETKYDELKHKLKIENFYDIYRKAIYQDYYIVACLSNLLINR